MSLNLALSVALAASGAPGQADEQAQAPSQDPTQEQAQTQPQEQPQGQGQEQPANAPVPMPVPSTGARKPLQGGVESYGLSGAAQGTGLTGGVQGQGIGLTGGAQDGGWQGTAQQGNTDQSRPPMQGSAQNDPPMALNAFADPDEGNQELMIDWDTWRNNLMQAVQAGTLAKINVQNDVNFVWDPRSQMMVSRYPDGTSTWYALDVLPNRTIINVRVTQHSRYPSYDQAVVQAIMDLQGNDILTYPRGSRRRIVSQESNVRTASQTQSQNFQFGDVETQRYRY